MMVWSYVMGLRRRWTGQDKGGDVWQRGDDRENGVDGRESIKAKFLRREPVIDCPYSNCEGMLVTGRREVSRWGRTGARVVLRCTRQPGHDFTLSVEPYSVEELERLRVALRRGERLDCVRCGTLLESAAVRSSGEPEKAEPADYRCRWCGLKWMPGGDLRRQAS